MKYFCHNFLFLNSKDIPLNKKYFLSTTEYSGERKAKELNENKINQCLLIKPD